MEVTLIVSDGPSKGRVIPLPGTIFTIGRASRCHLRPHCLTVSKLHCAIACWAGKVAVRDLNSANGTFVNGRQVFGEVRVRDGDALEVGSVTFRFRIKTGSAEALPVPIVRKSDLLWLIDSPPGPRTLEVSKTDLVPADSHSPAAGEGALSAGDYLRDFFRHGEPRS